MKTTFDQLTILFQFLTASSLKTQVTGGIYKLRRPDDSKAEDVVINSLPIVWDGSVSRGTANVNIYVPDLTEKVAGKVQSMPHTARLKHLSELALEAVQEQYGAGYNCYVSSQSLFAEEETQSHYVNLRIEFKFHQS